MSKGLKEEEGEEVEGVEVVNKGRGVRRGKAAGSGCGQTWHQTCYHKL